MSRYLIPPLFLSLLFTSALLLAVPIAFHTSPAIADTPESEEEEARERAERSAPPGGFRQGKITPQEVEIYLDGKKIGTVTPDELKQLEQKRIFSPRGPKVGWAVYDALLKEGVKNAKTVRFFDEKGKQLDLPWTDLERAKNEVVFTYNFNGQLILETDVSDKMPDHLKDTKEDQVREEMHKSRKRSLIFLRNVKRIELLSN